MDMYNTYKKNSVDFRWVVKWSNEVEVEVSLVVYEGETFCLSYIDIKHGALTITKRLVGLKEGPIYI